MARVSTLRRLVVRMKANQQSVTFWFYSRFERLTFRKPPALPGDGYLVGENDNLKTLVRQILATSEFIF